MKEVLDFDLKWKFYDKRPMYKDGQLCCQWCQRLLGTIYDNREGIRSNIDGVVITFCSYNCGIELTKEKNK